MKQQQQPIFEGEVAEIGLVYKSNVKASRRPQIRTNLDAVSIFRKFSFQHFFVYS